jgi:class 3 adenylate cyclase
MADGTDAASRAETAEPTADIHIFLFAEVRDYTHFSQERGDEEATRLVERFATLTRQVVERRAGKVIELRGDEALAVFSSARHALRAAVELQDHYIDETQRDPSLPLPVGVGLDAGEARSFEGGYRGRALNLAARLKDQARPGQVLATEALIHLAGQTDGLAYVERALIHPKGFALPVRVVQVMAEGQQNQHEAQPDEPELRTFLFADIRGYYKTYAAGRSDAAGATFETWYAHLVDEQIHARGGRVLHVRGDDAMAVFVSPRQANYAALELQERFQQAVEEECKLSLSLGIGVEAGEAIPVRGTYTGAVVLDAGRLCNLAKPGDVLVGETIFRLVRQMDGLLFVDRGQSQGGSERQPVRLLQVVREDTGTGEGSTSPTNADC